MFLFSSNNRVTQVDDVISEEDLDDIELPLGERKLPSYIPLLDLTLDSANSSLISGDVDTGVCVCVFDKNIYALAQVLYFHSNNNYNSKLFFKYI